MYIPLDNLYHWIASLASQPAFIYYFYPHGSKNLGNVITYPIISVNNTLRLSQSDRFNVFCYDQEPLNFDYYQNLSWQDFGNDFGLADEFSHNLQKFHTLQKEKNLNMYVHGLFTWIHDTTILLHSEKNSEDLTKYQQAGYACAYYWAHGVIARDWYRFAKMDQRLDHTNPVTDFLIYARDWSGSREYRLKFLDQLLSADLAPNSLCYFSPESPSTGQHYKSHSFTNGDFDQLTHNLDHVFHKSTVNATASADYDIEDHNATKISVILETSFDGARIQLTEKICRALACGHPFYLAAGPGSLQYLKSYGFETFEPWIDESYDSEINSAQRLQKIIASMRNFANLSPQSKQHTWRSMHHIARRNKEHFFSEAFAKQLQSELTQNLDQAFEIAGQTQAQRFLHRWRTGKKIYPRDSKHLNWDGVLRIMQLVRAKRLQYRNNRP